MTIRYALMEDIDALVAMGEQFIASTVYAGQVRNDPGARRRTLEALLTSPDGHVLVGEVAGDVVGCIVLVSFVHPWSGEKTMSELAWWVDPRHRGHGLRLLRAAEALAKEQGAWMQMIAPTGDLCGVYEKLGYCKLETAYTRRFH